MVWGLGIPKFQKCITKKLQKSLYSSLVMPRCRKLCFIYNTINCTALAKFMMITPGINYMIGCCRKISQSVIVKASFFKSWSNNNKYGLSLPKWSAVHCPIFKLGSLIYSQILDLEAKTIQLTLPVWQLSRKMNFLQ